MYDPTKDLLDRLWLRRREQVGSFSQFGEDREILARVGSAGLYADVGANHPYKGSNTYLLYRAGWRGLTLEPIKSHCEQHRSIRPEDVCINAAAGRSAASGTFHEMNPTGLSTFDAEAVAALVAGRRAVRVDSYEVPIVTLAEVWEEAFGQRRPDLVSIDTEGFEFEVLAGAKLEQLAPTLVLLEFESAVDRGRQARLVEVMGSSGYTLLKQFGVNGLFERNAGRLVPPK